MKNLLHDLGCLAAFKKLNRDDLAGSMGTTRQNLISAFKGRRPLPAAQMPSLRQALGLDDDYRFEPGRVHGLTATQGEKHRDLLLSLLRRCMTWPVRSKWFLRGIGEDRGSFAYVFEDSRGALVVVRNDDALLDAPGIRKNAEDAADAARREGQAGDENLAGLFSRADGSPEREMALAAFETLFTSGMSAESLRAALDSPAKVWTWGRLREKAERAGQNAKSAAKALGLVDSAVE